MKRGISLESCVVEPKRTVPVCRSSFARAASIMMCSLSCRSSGYGSSAAYYITEYLHVEQPTAYKRKNRALDRLTVLLFGKS